jgi:AIPR protein
MPTSSLVQLFKEQLENESQSLAQGHDLTQRGDFLIWWYFLKLRGLSPAEIDQIVCDGGSDLGIDAVQIDQDDYVHFYQFKNPEDAESCLPAGEVDKLLAGLRLILRGKHQSIANEELKGLIEDIYQIVPAGYRLHLVTSGKGIAKESVEKLKAFVEELGGPSNDFFVWTLEDIDYLQDAFYQKRLPTIEKPIVFQLERQPPYQVRSADHDCYMFHTDAANLANLYQVHGERLLQQNIRVFQGDRSTNAKIRQTCTTAEARNFLHYNNGVTFLCETAQWDQFIGKLTLSKAQVVNGGQTIRVLSKAQAEGTLQEGVLIAVRVITSQGDKEFSSDVAVNLNNQNRIETSFLRSNEPRVVQLAAALESVGWYLERREDEVSHLSALEIKAIEQRIGHGLEGRVIKLRDGTQAYTATYFRQPELAKKNPKRIFLGPEDGGSFDRVFGPGMSAEKFVVAQRLKWVTDGFVERFMNLKRRKARGVDWVSEYTELLGPKLVHEFGDRLDQVVPQCSVFLCALLFEDHIVLRNEQSSTLLTALEAGDLSAIYDKLAVILQFARDNPTSANKSWPTLLKSQPFFENVASYLHGRVGPRNSAPGGRANVQNL